jgi:hypothetical protein
MIANKTDAPMNALTMLALVYTTKITEKLRPINAANPSRAASATDFGGLLFKNGVIINTATSGANITTHFITPVNKNCISWGLVLIT